MNKKIHIMLLAFFIFVNNLFAGRFPYTDVKPLSKGNYTYKASALSFNGTYFIGRIILQSNNSPSFKYYIPIYLININESIDSDIQEVLIKAIEFKDDETILITNEDDYTFELNINTFKVTPINCKSPVFSFDEKLNKTEPISGKTIKEVITIHENSNKILVEKNINYKYTGKQPAKRKLPEIEDAISVTEEVLFQLNDKELIRNEQPYIINKYKNLWIIDGSYNSSVFNFRIVINANNSKVETLFYSE